MKKIHVRIRCSIIKEAYTGHMEDPKALSTSSGWETEEASSQESDG